MPKPPVAPAPDAVRPDTLPPTLSVLVVDDEPLIRWSLKRAFCKRGHEVIEAADAAEALSALALRDQRFDVVLLDYRLPDCRDSSLLEAVRTLAPDAAVFMMTAYGDEPMRASAHTLGAKAVVDKPFDVGVLVAMIEGSSRPA